jgi:uroporphyrinogen III methyltransferase/synthase
LSHSLSPHVSQPLSGKRFLLTRPEDESNAVFVQGLQAMGAEVIQLPFIVTEPLPVIWPALSAFDWLFFTSKNSVNAMGDLPIPQGTSIACVGPATEKTLRAKGLTARFVSPIHEAESAARIFLENYPGNGLQILWPCGNLANPKLKLALEQASVQVTALTVYETRLRSELSEPERSLLNASFDLLLFTSASAVNAFQQTNNLDWERWAQTPVACLGPQTSKTALTVFGHVEIQAEPYTLEGLLRAIVVFFDTNQPEAK